jgi:hypothetical protein
VLFDFIYPGQRVVPSSLLAALARRAAEPEEGAKGDPVCQGVLLSRKQYRIDTESWRMRDARLDADVSMTPGEILDWTAATPAAPGPDAED